MKCFRHIDNDAIGTGEIYVGRTDQGETYRIVPLCKPCFDGVVAREEEQKMMKDNQKKGVMVLLTIFAVTVLLFNYFS